MTQRERMDAGLIYDPGDEDIMAEQTAYADLIYEYNATRPSDFKRLGRKACVYGRQGICEFQPYPG